MTFIPFKVAETLGRSHRARPGDVIGTKRALARLGHYKVPVWGISPWPDEALFGGLEGFQRKSGLVADGVMRPPGPTESALDAALGALERGAGGGDRSAATDKPERLFDVAGAVGLGRANQPADIVPLKHALALTGHYADGDPEQPAFDLPLLHAIRSFQKDAGVTQDGWLAPDGETARALDDALGPVVREVETGNAQSDQPENQEQETQVAESGASPFPRRGPLILQLIPLLKRLQEMGIERFPPDRKADDNPGLPAHPETRPDGKQGTPADPPKSEPLPGREALDDEIVKEMMKPLESHRGDEWTQRGNDIVAEECRNVLKELYPHEEPFIEHIGGATQDGKGESELSEKRVPRPDAAPGDSKGSRYPDLTWEDLRSGDPKNPERAHLNTATTRGSSDPETPVYTSREEKSFEGLVKNAGEDLATIMPKLRPGMSEEEYRKIASNACKDVFRKWLGEPASARQ